MSVTPTNGHKDPDPAEPPNPETRHAVIAVVTAVWLAVVAGLLIDWPTAVTVLVSVLGVFARSGFTPEP
ncbi:MULTISPECIES: hypothetical protein [Nocardia]|uniref:hypothetical protein n=1 Tax=Nocardia TaxID=1817 RepID=UPI0006D04398|nr:MULTISPECIES: hypothetical protein [Nocardia]